MAQHIPKTTKQWNVSSYDGKDGFNALKYSEQEVPELGHSEVLVKLHAASINYRDLIIPLGKFPFPVTDNVIPGSDGAGTVIAVGPQVTRFEPGDKVVTLFSQEHIGGRSSKDNAATGLGGARHGTLRSVGAFNEQGLVLQPSNLTTLEAATLPCAGVTAWNALYGVSDNQVQPGQWVLTQGTGGVSIFALQFAKAAGAKVIATTGSNDKIEVLKKLGADHVINYKENPEWGTEATKLTDGVGVDHVVEVAGPKSMEQSLKAIRISGLITIIGFVGGFTNDQPGFLDCLTNLCTTRGIMVGSRQQMEDMCRAIEAHPEKLRPVVDGTVFELENLKDAYEYQWAGKHFGKVCVKIP
ncbi:hypothetical protein QQS21_005799 [Conoideocrella luteorostrata]|uniref:Enoyl reductase (ER) domain-containing protein n=1 Tax=Conoideocrella luteorostrata TaxID=1105319 RepID=A0AAJ0FYN3_9HYPO|nr:hypothetical protein QQS21_005799 [Conoideocrella luteorostrata]